MCSVIHENIGLPHWWGRGVVSPFKLFIKPEVHSTGTTSIARPPLAYCKRLTREATSVAACRAKPDTSLSVCLAFIFCSACNFSLGMFDGSVRKFHWLCPMRYFCSGVWPAVGAKAKSNSGCTFRTQHGFAPAAPRAPLICPSEATAPLTPQLEYGNSR